MNNTLASWNLAAPAEAEHELLPCNGSRKWALELVLRRPFADAEELFAAADAVWWKLGPEDWQEAFDSHPRIGERHARAASALSLSWSAGEQSAASEQGDVQAALAAGNRQYEERFGRIFLICATGKSAAQMLAVLQSRLQNDPAAELREAAEQQRRITQLRLRKWLVLPPASCEDV